MQATIEAPVALGQSVERLEQALGILRRINGLFDPVSKIPASPHFGWPDSVVISFLLRRSEHSPLMNGELIYEDHSLQSDLEKLFDPWLRPGGVVVEVVQPGYVTLPHIEVHIFLKSDGQHLSVEELLRYEFPPPRLY